MRIKTILKWYLLITSIYLIGDGLMHVFNIKLINAGAWPEPSLVYSKNISFLFGMFAILAACFGIEASRNLKKYRNFLKIAGIWSIFYGVYLVYISITVDFIGIFEHSPSVYAWMPFYNSYLIFEAGLLFVLAILIFLYHKYDL